VTTGRNVAVAIGIGDAKPCPFMQGALNGAREFHDWASSLGYEARLVTDETLPVTIPILRAELEAALSPSGQRIHRFLLYFAGHGLIREAEEGLWLLSDWNHELKAVAVEALKRRLYMHDIEQLAIFSDSCRSLPPNITAADLAPDPVLGRGPMQQRVEPAIDKFVAAQDGSSAFMVPGDNPEDDRCLFSGVLMEGLWGARPEAFSKLDRNNVTSRSLGSYLKSEVPKKALSYACTLDPSVSPTFPEGDDIYFGGFGTGPRPKPPTFRPWPPARPLTTTVGAGIAAGAPATRRSFEVQFEADTGKRSVTRRRSTLERIRDQARPQGFETGSGFAVEGSPITAIWTPRDVIAEVHGQENWWRLRHERNGRLIKAEPVLIEFEDGLFSATTALPEFIATLLRDERGIMAQIYRPVTYDGTSRSGTAAELAIARLEGGGIRADEASDLAVGLREMKHFDPVLGVVSAYLYDSIGDWDNIRRMAYYYVDNNQPIPYDIALLAQLKGEWRGDSLWAHVPAVAKRKPRTMAEEDKSWTYDATREAQGPVGGLWPWMKQGWLFLDDPTDAGSILIHSGLSSVLKDLTSSRFTTLTAQGGKALAAIFGLVENHPPARRIVVQADHQG